jgi:hypothetical protein
MMVHHLVKTERGEILSDVRPANFTLERVRLEVLLVGVRKLRHRTRVLESSNRVTNDEWLLQVGSECARDYSIGDIIARNDIEPRIGTDARDTKMPRSKKRDKRRICCVAVDPPREGTSPAR